MLSVQWITGRGGQWGLLEWVRLAEVIETGVYVIWHEGNPSRTVRVGSGDIASQLLAHRRDREILDHKQYGALRVTWAAVPPELLEGVERFLADALAPRVGAASREVQPVVVNLPW
jgi:hypothetical protein